jgi:hypothetical protein
MTLTLRPTGLASHTWDWARTLFATDGGLIAYGPDEIDKSAGIRFLRQFLDTESSAYVRNADFRGISG